MVAWWLGGLPINLVLEFTCSISVFENICIAMMEDMIAPARTSTWLVKRVLCSLIMKC